jgi:hypothetical protein
MFARGRLVQLMYQALDGGAGEAIGFAFPDEGVAERPGFRFRFHAGRDSTGWLALDEDGERFTLLHVRLDIEPEKGTEGLNFDHPSLPGQTRSKPPCAPAPSMRRTPRGSACCG